MPQVDLETLVCASDSKVATCESSRAPSPLSAPPEDDLRFPSSASLGWSGNSLSYRVYDREESTKGLTNPKSRASSDRFSGSSSAAAGAGANPPSSKPPIIGLPAKIQTSRYDGRCVRRPTQGRIFPKKRGRGGAKKSAVPVYEPGSPKVSFFGKVLSDTERARRRREQQRGRRGEEPEPEPRGGCWARFAAMLGCGGRDGGVTEAALRVQRSGSSARPSRSVPPEKTARKSWTAEQPAEAGPGLEGMKRFSSGRRAASWGEEAEMKGRRSVGSAE